MPFEITTQRQLRRAFWENNPNLSRKKVDGDYLTDTRVAFVDFVDACVRNRIISEALAQRASLREGK